jgi:signal peptidase II
VVLASKFNGRWWPFAFALAVVAADRLTKDLVQQRFGAFDSTSVISGWLRFMHTENTGAAFGMLSDGSPAIRAVVLLGVSLAVMIFVITTLLSRANANQGWLNKVGLALVLGGAAGNLYDRVFRGSVTDFIEVYHGSWSFPAFNLADSAITIGAILLLLNQLRPQEKLKTELRARPEVNT